jgi:hypothetical protein
MFVVAALTASSIGALLSSACNDPVADDLITSLGPEKSGIRRGPLHRAGQPCLACHGGYGPGQPEFAFAGTIYATPTDTTPVNGAKIKVTDATGQSREVYANCAGNFFQPSAQWQPIFPLRVEIECTEPVPEGSPAGTVGVVKRSVMQTRVSRDGSCASCHFGAPSETSPGRIACGTDQPNPPYTLLSGCFAGGG